MAEIGAVNSLVAELLAAGRAKANNVVRLLALLSTSKQETAVKTAIQGLKQFFVAAGQDGLLMTDNESGSRPAKRQKVAGPAEPTTAAGSGDAEAQFREWLKRQYGSFVSQLLSLATGTAAAPSSGSTTTPVAASAAPRSPGLQVVAAAAVMECVRSEQGPGVFSGELYGRLLAGVLTSPSVRPEVFSLLFTKYLPLADVRFYTLAAVKAVADRYSLVAAKARAQGADEEEEEEEASGEGAGSVAAAAAAVSAVAAAAAAGADGSDGSGSGPGGRGVGSATVSVPDLARNTYDVLCHVADALPPDTREWSTWCGAAEYNLVTAAADKNESARLRRKRQQQQQPPEGPPARGVRKVPWANLLTQRRLYGDAWLALLALPLPADVLRKALVRLPSAVIPHMVSPQLLADFLTHCLNRGGLTGMLALNGLFLLVTRHGLEYPQFYNRLYQLLVPQAFAARSRAQFFRLADLFLSSPLVPAYTVAAFAKRFARLGLGAPPAGAMIAIAFIHNLLRRHPALCVMLHNPQAANAAAAAAAAADDVGAAEPAGTRRSKTAAPEGLGVDPYDEAEADPAKSRAVESSLWEVEALRNHYCPQVSTFCAVLDKDLTDRVKTAEVNLEVLLGTSQTEGKQPGGAGSYNALISGELSRKLRKAPVAFYAQSPASLFATNLDTDDWAGWMLSTAVN